MITLAAGDWRATLNPELGGAVTTLSWRGRDVLRPTPNGADDPLQTACFPLVPYANRIDRGRFVFEGREVRLTSTPGFEPHALHGDGWRRPWRVEAEEGASVTLVLEHPRGDWPWSWSARQLIQLDEAGLAIRLSMTNTDDAPMPAGLGLHPYLLTRAGDRVRLDAPSVWIGESLIPDRLAAAREIIDWRSGVARVSAPFVDNAYETWAGLAQVTGGEHTVRLTSDASRLHVYAPVGDDFICLEPMTHRPNAVNAPVGDPSGLVVLAPDETLRLSMRLTVQAAQ